MKSCTTAIFSGTHRLWGDLHPAVKAERWNTSPSTASATPSSGFILYINICIYLYMYTYMYILYTYINICIYLRRYNPGLASTEVLNFQPVRIRERSRSFGSFEAAENTQHVLGCSGLARLAQNQSLSFPPLGWLSWDTRRVCSESGTGDAKKLH